MQKYLSEREYVSHYGTPENCELLQFDSIEEIDQLISAERIGSKKDILQLRRNAYQRFQCKVEECLNQLRNKKAYVRNLNEIWDDPDRVCEFFGVEKEYQCETVGEYRDIMIAGKKESVFTLTDGTTMTLSLEELHRAFELGFITIEEICQAKKQNGSLEAVLN